MDPSVIESLKTLGLLPNATLKEIKQAYKDLVTVWHPDRFANNPRLHEKASEKLKELNVAYNEIMSHYQNMIFTERTPNVQDTPQYREPEPTPFSPPDKPQKSSGFSGYTGLLSVLFIVAAVYFIWGQNYPVGINAKELFHQIKMSLPQSAAPVPAAIVSSPQVSDKTTTDLKPVAAIIINRDQAVSPEKTIPAAPTESKIESKKEIKQIALVQITDNQAKKKEVERPQPIPEAKAQKKIKQTTAVQISDHQVKKKGPERTQSTPEEKIKKASVVQFPVKISERPDISWLNDDEQSSIKSACSEAKLAGSSSYNHCLKNQLTLLAQGEKRPDISRLTYEEKSSIESVCSHAKFKDGPASYNKCLMKQLATLAQGEKRPDISRLTYEEKSSIECVCSGAKMEGPASYNRCLNNHLATLIKNERRADLSYLSPEQKSSITSACGVAKMEGPANYNRCLNNHLKTVKGR